MCSDRLVPARREPSSRSPVRGRGRGQQAAGGTRPRLSAIGRLPDPGFPRAAARVLSLRARGRTRGGEPGPAPAHPPCCGNQLRGRGRERAGRVAGGTRRGKGPQRSQSERRPPPTPRARRRLPSPSGSSPTRERRRSTWRPGLGCLGRRRAHPLPPIASVCPIPNQVVVRWWEIRGTCSVREGKVAPLKTPLGRGA